jgi:hypothetical protein
MAGVTSTVVKESAEELILNPLSIGNISGQALMQQARGKRVNK